MRSSISQRVVDSGRLVVHCDVQRSSPNLSLEVHSQLLWVAYQETNILSVCEEYLVNDGEMESENEIEILLHFLSK